MIIGGTKSCNQSPLALVAINRLIATDQSPHDYQLRCYSHKSGRWCMWLLLILTISCSNVNIEARHLCLEHCHRTFGPLTLCFVNLYPSHTKNRPPAKYTETKKSFIVPKLAVLCSKCLCINVCNVYFGITNKLHIYTLLAEFRPRRPVLLKPSARDIL